MIAGERAVRRSAISVKLIAAGMSLNKRCTVMPEYSRHGGLLIEMEDNVIVQTMIGYFLSLFFCAYFSGEGSYSFSKNDWRIYLWKERYTQLFRPS